MACLEIIGGEKLYGEAFIQGSKNAVLPILAACILCKEENCIKRCPNIRDTSYMFQLLEMLGGSVRKENEHICINISNITKNDLQLDIAKEMRASVLLVGPVLARTGAVCFSQPGGCVIGKRPIDLHLYVLKQLNVEILQKDGYILGRSKGLKGGKIYLPFPSVGATENIMIAASLSDGEVVIENAANEPEIIDLANFLCSMGGEIYGAGTDTITIKGKSYLHPTEYSVIPDRIEAGTFLTMAVACKSNLTLKNVIPDHLSPVIAKLNEMGVGIKKNESSIEVLPCDKFKAVDIKTLPHPGFPTDMQSQFMSLLSIADGTGVVVETVFENRFMQVPELIRMGANIKIDGRTAVIDGTRHLSGAKVRATDLRAGAALVIAALSAKGQSEISDIEHIERGYENFEQKLSEIGVKIKKI